MKIKKETLYMLVLTAVFLLLAFGGRYGQTKKFLSLSNEGVQTGVPSQSPTYTSLVQVRAIEGLLIVEAQVSSAAQDVSSPGGEQAQITPVQVSRTVYGSGLEAGDTIMVSQPVGMAGEKLLTADTKAVFFLVPMATDGEIVYTTINPTQGYIEIRESRLYPRTGNNLINPGLSTRKFYNKFAPKV